MAAAMSQLSQEDAKLASQCLEICQTLAGKSLPFAFCINIGSNFSFSVDTRGKEVEVLANPKRKKKTPSTLRRDARRREDFLNKKLNAPTAEKTFKCDQCDGTFKSENGLKIHIGKAHKTPQPKENLRHSAQCVHCTVGYPCSIFTPVYDTGVYFSANYTPVADTGV